MLELISVSKLSVPTIALGFSLTLGGVCVVGCGYVSCFIPYVRVYVLNKERR